jgi:hypothetical protein
MLELSMEKSFFMFQFSCFCERISYVGHVLNVNKYRRLCLNTMNLWFSSAVTYRL